MTRLWRLIAASGLSALIVAACGVGGSAVSISPSPSVAPSIAPSVGSSIAPTPNSAVESIIATGPGPIGLAATSENVWVELHRDDQIARIDPATNQQVELTGVPAHCAVAASGESVWATIAKRNLVTQFAASGGEAVGSWDIPSACGVAVEADTAWVTSPSEGAVYVLQEGVAEPLKRIVVAPDVFGIALDETSAWVTSESDGGTLWRIDRTTNQASLVGKFGGVDAVAVAFGSLWLSSRPADHLWKVDPSDGTVLGEHKFLAAAGVVAVDDDLWLVLYGGVLQLDPATLDIRSQKDLRYEYLGAPLFAFGSLWISALEENVVLRVAVTH
jgi:hypothetical protein